MFKNRIWNRLIFRFGSIQFNLHSNINQIQFNPVWSNSVHLYTQSVTKISIDSGVPVDMQDKY